MVHRRTARRYSRHVTTACPTMLQKWKLTGSRSSRPSLLSCSLCTFCQPIAADGTPNMMARWQWLQDGCSGWTLHSAQMRSLTQGKAMTRSMCEHAATYIAAQSGIGLVANASVQEASSNGDVWLGMSPFRMRLPMLNCSLSARMVSGLYDLLLLGHRRGCPLETQ